MEPIKNNEHRRFDEKYTINPSGCWEWTSNKSHNGYGLFKANGRQLRSHRYSYERFVGIIPDGNVICHKCDNPSCVNPAHLFAGTTLDNVRDSMAKGRSRAFKCDQFGEFNPNSKLSIDSALQIRQCFSLGKSRKEIAIQFGVHYNTVKNIILGKSWITESKLDADRGCNG